MWKDLKQHIETLKSLDCDHTLVEEEKVVAYISGSSHYEHAELADIQKNLLNEIGNKGQTPVMTNFPFNKGFREENPLFPNLMHVTLSNVLYYCTCLLHPELKQEIKRHIEPLLQKPNEVTLIAYSSGLHMLTLVLNEIDIKAEKVKIIALGPVSFKKLKDERVEYITIKGKKDIFSVILDRHKVDEWVDAYHTSYLRDERVKEIISEVVFDTYGTTKLKKDKSLSHSPSYSEEHLIERKDKPVNIKNQVNI